MTPTSILLIGCGAMGGAMLAGWVEQGNNEVVVLTPRATSIPRQGKQVTAVSDVADVPFQFSPDVVVVATKPQQAETALSICKPFAAAGALVVSIMAGRTVADIAAALGHEASVVRAMPNTPAAVRQGFTCCYARPGMSGEQRGLADRLLRAVGDVAWLEDEELIDLVTAVSGGGPAYVFLLAEVLEQAAMAHGLPAALARRMVRRIVAGSGVLLEASEEHAAQLRINVTSPNGTTEHALAVLMAPDAWPKLMREAIAAAAQRSRALGKNR